MDLPLISLYTKAGMDVIPRGIMRRTSTPRIVIPVSVELKMGANFKLKKV